MCKCVSPSYSSLCYLFIKKVSFVNFFKNSEIEHVCSWTCTSWTLLLMLCVWVVHIYCIFVFVFFCVLVYEFSNKNNMIVHRVYFQLMWYSCIFISLPGRLHPVPSSTKIRVRSWVLTRVLDASSPWLHRHRRHLVAHHPQPALAHPHWKARRPQHHWDLWAVSIIDHTRWRRCSSRCSLQQCLAEICFRSSIILRWEAGNFLCRKQVIYVCVGMYLNCLIYSSHFTLMQTIHGKGSTGCEYSDGTSHSIISYSGLVIFSVYKLHID